MRGAIALCIGLGLFCAQARGDDQHYQDFIVGDEAMGLGGAYTAIAADPSGGWYNPAGIVDVRDTSLSLSANLYGVQDSSTGGTASLDPEGAIAKLSVVPSSAGFVQSLGRIDGAGKRPYAFGMTLVVPSYRKFSVTEEGSFQGSLGEVESGYTRNYTDSTLWAGLLGALRASPWLSFGAGLFLMHRSVQDSANSYVATALQAGEFHTFRSAMTELDFSNYSLVAAIGMKLEILPGLFIGALVRSPSLSVYASGKMRFARARSDGTDATFKPTPQEVSVESETRINGEARFGVAYVVRDLLKVAADVSVHMPVSYTLISVADPVAREALLIAPDIERNMVINMNLGAEMTILQFLSIGLGGFTNFSSSPDIPTDAERPAPAHVNMYGGTLAAGYSSLHSLTRIGILYARGVGADIHAVNRPDQLDTDSQGFARVDLTQSYLYFFLSSTFKY